MKQHYKGGSWYALFTEYGGLKPLLIWEAEDMP